MKRTHRHAEWIRDNIVPGGYSTIVRITTRDSDVLVSLFCRGDVVKSIEPDWDAAVFAVERRLKCRVVPTEAEVRDERWSDGTIVQHARKFRLYCKGTKQIVCKYAYEVADVRAGTPSGAHVRITGVVTSWEHAIEIGRKLVPVVRAAIEAAAKAEGA